MKNPLLFFLFTLSASTLFAQGPLIGSFAKVYQPYDSIYVEYYTVNTLTFHTYPHSVERIYDSIMIHFKSVSSGINVLFANYISTDNNNVPLKNQKATLTFYPSGNPCITHEVVLQAWYKNDLSMKEIPLRIVFPKSYHGNIKIIQKDSGQTHLNADITYTKCNPDDNINDSLIKWEISSNKSGEFDSHNLTIKYGTKSFHWFSENGKYVIRSTINLPPEMRVRYDTIDVVNAVNPSIGLADEFSLSSINISPNPVKNKLEITCSESFSEILLFNAHWNEIARKKLNGVLPPVELDVSEIPRGFYFLRIQTNQGKFLIKKIIVNP